MAPARLVLAHALVAFAVLAGAGVGANATSAYTLIVEPQVVEAGGSVQATGRGYDIPGEELHLRLDKASGVRLANVTVDRNGTFSTAATIPAGTEPGPHQIIVCRTERSACFQLAAASIRVVSPPEPTPDPSPDPTAEPPPPEPTLVPPPPDPDPPDQPPQDETVPLLTPTPTAPDELTTTDDPLCCDPPAPVGPGQVQQNPVQTQPPLVNPFGGDGDEIVDLYVRAIEVTQNIQDFDSSMPLVADRRTWIRVHPRVLHSPETPLDAIGGAVLLRRTDGSAETILYPRNLAAHHGPGIDRTDPDSALNFLVPPEWDDDGSLLVRALIWWTHPSTIDDENNSDNNLLSTNVTFHDGVEPLMYVTPLDDGAGPGPAASPALGMAGLIALYEGLLTYHPVADALPILLPEPVEPASEAATPGLWDLTTGEGRTEPLMRLFWVHEGMDLSEEHRIFGVFDDSIPSDVYSGWAKSWLRSTWIKPVEATAAHEGAHLVGLGHVDCVGTEEDGGALDPTYPNGAPDCSLAPVDPDGHYGFTVLDEEPQVYSNDPAHPAAAFPLMSYQDPAWSDPYHYCKMLNFYDVPCSTSDIGVPGIPIPEPPHGNVDCTPESSDGIALELCLNDPNAPDYDNLTDIDIDNVHVLVPEEPDEWVLVTGHLDRESQSVTGAQLAVVSELNTTMRSIYDNYLTSVRQGAFAGGGGGANEIRMQDSSGSTEFVMPFDFGLESGNGHGPGGTEDPEPADQVSVPFAQIVPITPGITELGIVVEDWDFAATLPLAAVPPDPPSVDLGSWSKAEGLSVSWDVPEAQRVDVLWSADGQQWYPVVIGSLHNGVDIPPDAGFPGGEVRLKVVVNDGGRRAETVTEPITVPDGAPRAQISSITDGQTVGRYDMVDLRSVSQDPEDGLLDGDALAWTSDLDGELGTGRWVSTDELSVGAHVITLAATDSSGASAEMSVELTVLDDGSPAPLMAGALPDAEERLIAGTATLPSSGVSGVLIAAIGAAVAVGAGVATTLYVRRRKGTV
jgi:hypothetical protein